MNTYGMFEQFSRGYYLGRLYVEPGSGTRAAMSSEQLVTIDCQLHDREEKRSPAAAGPVVVKVGRRHYRVRGADTVDAGHLQLPRTSHDLEAGEHRPVLLAKAGRAHQLVGLAGGDDSDGDRPPRDPFVPDALLDVFRPGSS